MLDDCLWDQSGPVLEEFLASALADIVFDGRARTTLKEVLQHPAVEARNFHAILDDERALFCLRKDAELGSGYVLIFGVGLAVADEMEFEAGEFLCVFAH